MHWERLTVVNVGSNASNGANAGTSIFNGNDATSNRNRNQGSQLMSLNFYKNRNFKLNPQPSKALLTAEHETHNRLVALSEHLESKDIT